MFYYIRYRLDGDIFGVQTQDLETALRKIRGYVGFQEILQIVDTDRYSLVLQWI